MKNRVIAVLLFLACVLLPVWSDNQIVYSEMASQIASEESAVYSVSVQSYVAQLGINLSVATATSTNATYSSDYDLSDLAAARVMLASGDGTYPVTSGDRYSLTYLAEGRMVTVPVYVVADANIAIPNVGTFSWSGKTFTELKSQIEAAVLVAFPFSSPVLSITSTGAFTVYVTGDVTSSSSAELWGNNRLSDVAYLASDTASTRRVTIIHSDGTSTVCDLYLALREGSSENNPRLKQGDSVVFEPKNTLVTIAGAVNREGSYQLLAGENLDTLIEKYAQSLLPSANTNDIRVRRYSDGTYTETVVKAGSGYVLRDGDVVVVRTIEKTLGSVSIEGAVMTTSSTSMVQGNAASSFFFRFAEGDTVREMLTAMSSYFIPASDLDGAYLIRDGESIALNFRTILYGNDPDGDIALRNGDRFVIPFNQLIVTVNGAVNSPGVFGYVPGRTASYYISLAGGLSSSAKSSGHYEVFNKYGEKLADDDIVPSEAVIKVDRSTFTTDLATAVSIVGLVASIISITLNVVKLSTGNYN